MSSDQKETQDERNQLVTLLEKQGKELLEKDRQINIITLEQFNPFIELFNGDRARMDNDVSYRDRMIRLYNEYVHGLGINLFEPTVVIASKEDPTELYFLDRVKTRIAAAAPDSSRHRDSVPSVVSPVTGTTREQMIVEANVADVLEANATEAQKDYFRRASIESAIVNHMFVMRNLSPEKRDEMLAQLNPATDGETPSSNVEVILIDDDD